MCLNSNDKRQQAKGRKTEYFLGNGEIPHITSEIKPPLTGPIRPKVQQTNNIKKHSIKEGDNYFSSVYHLGI